MPRTLRIELDAANLDEVRAALSCAAGLVLAVNALEDLVPGKASPVVLPRQPLDEVIAARDALVASIGELVDAADPGDDPPEPGEGAPDLPLAGDRDA